VDFGLFKKELSKFDYSGKQVWVDLGFTGIKDYLSESQVQIGHKNPETKNFPKNQSYKIRAYQK
jgi:hypothetical protein